MMHFVQPDDRLPGVNVLLNVEALSARIGNWIGKGELSVANIRYKPATSCLVSYIFKTDDQREFVHAKAFEPNNWPIRRKKISEGGIENNVWIDDEFCFAVFKFPLDAELPDLAEFATAPETFLSKVLFEEFELKPGLRDFENFQILAYKPNRRFVAKLNFSDDESLVLKIHDRDSFAEVLQTASTLKKLAIKGVPKRAGRSARHKVLASCWLRGETCDLGRQNASIRRQTMEKIFDYLDRLHRPVNTRKIKLPVRGPAHAIESVSEYLSKICPALAPKANRILRELLFGLPSEYSPSLVHGDFYDQQLIIDQSEIRACDLDNCCVDDSSVDVANLVAHLRLRACRNELKMDVAEEVNVLVLERLAKTGDQHTQRRFTWNQSASLFRLATHPFRNCDSNWIEQTQCLLDQVDQQLKLAKKTSVALGCDADDCMDASAESQAAVIGDPGFGFLDGAFDRSHAEAMLEKHLSKLNKRIGNFSINRILSRRHKPGRRCLIEYELVTDQGLRSVLGKASAKRFDRRAYKSQQELYKKHQFGEASADGIRVPPTIGYVDSWQMWFQKKVEGVTAGALMHDEALLPVAEKIAAALSKLHRSSFVPVRLHSIQDELAILTDRLQKMMKRLPQKVDEIEQVLNNCIHLGESITNHRNVPIHRDFYQDQILFDEDRTYLLDLDLVSLGHPATDVGNFIAHLTEHGIRIHNDPNHWISEEAEIKKQYLVRNPDCSDADIESFKTLSLARHISISWELVERRSATPQILSVVQQRPGLLTDSQLVELT